MSPRRIYLLGLFAVLGGLCAALILGMPFRYAAALALVACLTLMAGLLYKPTRWIAAGFTIVLVIIFWGLLRPVCVAISAESLAQFDPPIETRTDRDGYMDVFQQLPTGNWQQCKMAVSRWFFF